MKKICALFGLLLCLNSSQAQHEVPTHLFELKVTPTSMLNLRWPTLLVGAEVLLSPKIGLQLEYGMQLSTNRPFDMNYIFLEEERGNWLYQRIKGEFKWYTFHKKGFSDYLSFGLYHTGQSYPLNNRSVTLENGQRVRVLSATMNLNDMAYFINKGGKIWFRERFFMEYYLGAGFKKTSNRLVQSIDATPDPDVMPRDTYFLNLSNYTAEEGDWHRLFVDFGFKLGLSF